MTSHIFQHTINYQIFDSSYSPAGEYFSNFVFYKRLVITYYARCFGMIGNIILCVATYVVYKRFKKNQALSLPIGMVLGCVLKAAFMGGVISNCLLVYTKAVQNLKPEALAAAKVTFSGTQLITALIGSAIAYVIWLSAGKYLKSLSE